MDIKKEFGSNGPINGDGKEPEMLVRISYSQGRANRRTEKGEKEDVSVTSGLNQAQLHNRNQNYEDEQA